MSKPSDFMLGILDFLAVLLPGAIATWLLSQHLPKDMRSAFDLASGEHAKVVPWVVYLLSSYALGHFVFMGGSKLDSAYDRWRRCTKSLEAEVPFQAAKRLRQKLTPNSAARHSPLSSGLAATSGFIAPKRASRSIASKPLPNFSKLGGHFLFRARSAVFHVRAGRRLGRSGHRGVRAVVLALLRSARWQMTELTYATAVIVYETKSKTNDDSRANEEGEDDDLDQDG